MEPRLTPLIEAAEKRDGLATEQLSSALYSELHQLAKRQLARRGGGISLAVTELLHEAYLDIAARNASLEDTVAEGAADERELAQIGEALDKLAVVEPDLAESSI